MATSSGTGNSASPAIVNNRQFNREQLAAVTTAGATNESKQGLTSGFEYAVQPDGTSLQERKWIELRHVPHTCFTLYKAPTTGCVRRLSLTTIDDQVRQNAARHSKLQNLPSEAPAKALSYFTSTTTSSAAAAATVPVPAHEPPSILNDSCNAVEPRDFTPSRRRVRNRHNAVFGQHLPTSRNSPALAVKVFGQQGIASSEQEMCRNIFRGPPSSNGFQRASALNNGHNNNCPADRNDLSSTAPLSFPENQDPLVEDDDDYDVLLATIDVEQLISQRSNTNNRAVSDNAALNRSHVSLKPPPPPPPLSNNNSFYDLYANEFDVTDFEEEPRSRASAENSSASYNLSLGNNRPTLNSEQTHRYENINSYGFSTNEINNNDDNYGSSDTSANCTATYLGNYNALCSSSSTPFPPPASTDGAPLCPGHNLSCLVLTARSKANNGRQFYKCAMPDDDQKCDFFQWADGMEGNWNNGSVDVGDEGPLYGARDIKDALTESRHKFGHRSFRPGQKEVIENAMTGRDVFVLMPTGGGKSLCYQLPAWCCPGLTVVISPLLSLIQDQVQSMTKLGVASVFLASSQDYQTEQMDITRRLNETTAHGGIKLLYITPEKLNNSQMMQSLLRRLHNKKLLSRFVVDEAHCLSDWGHDFRPDYNKLGMLRREFPGVPLMALTATANEKVVSDAIRALEMRNEYRYKSSFNRPNLRYEVRKKDGKTIDAIADYISKRPTESGVIYCLSRKDCENLAEKLEKQVRSKPRCNRVRVSFYHAEVDAHERERRHSEWSNGIISVLCATIAFGMGIDKPDVRYVIHYSMPKSITHYYQESGRAGRDGDIADCILYYTYKDKKILEHMIVQSSNDSYSQATRRKIDQLFTCVRYCEDEFQCRRTMQLDFFGENFDRSKCNKTCDNCKAQRESDKRDLTSVAQTILRLFTDLSQQKRGTGVTLVQLIELFRGSKSKDATKFLDTCRLKGYGAGSKYKKPEVDRIAHAMVFDRIISEKCVQNKGGFKSDYVELAENAMAVQNGTRKFFVNFPNPIKKVDAEKENQASKPRSTKKTKIVANMTSKIVPVPATKSRGARTGAASSVARQPPALCIDESSDDDDDEEPDVAVRVRSAGNKSQSMSVLPHEATQVLISRIKTLATNWAEEERMYGKNMFYWNILSNEAMKSIAAQVPTTVEDLKAIGVLGENIIKEYGERIVKIVSSYVAQEGLEEYIARRPSKKAKIAIGSPSSPAVVELLDDDDEFGMGIDLSAIDLPDFKPAAAKAKKAAKASRYFDL